MNGDPPLTSSAAGGAGGRAARGGFGRLAAVVLGLGLVLAACGDARSTASPANPGPVTSSPAATGQSAAPAESGAGPEATDGGLIGGFIPVAVASRIVISDLGIDLPIVSSDLEPPPDNYGLCDVAQYLTTFSQPDDAGATYLYAHSQAGMFLPLYEASTRSDGAELIGDRVEVYTSDGVRHTYEVFEVRPGSTDFSLAEGLAPDERRLVLQTSESPAGGTTNLVVAARPVDQQPVELAEANPEPHPRQCRPGATAEPTEPPVLPSAPVATRIVVSRLGIDLPVVSGDLILEGNTPGYPLCDVAQYLARYRQPAEAGTTYLYAHARTGMFLPLLEASKKPNQGDLLGTTIEVYTEDAMRYTYEIFEIQPDSTDFSLADIVPADEQRLILQTSIGPKGTVPKLVLAARLVATDPADPSVVAPTARPRVCA
ncbi:MAG: sortase [Candidatus Limnocylindrales bacterium]